MSRQRDPSKRSSLRIRPRTGDRRWWAAHRDSDTVFPVVIRRAFHRLADYMADASIGRGIWLPTDYVDYLDRDLFSLSQFYAFISSWSGVQQRQIDILNGIKPSAAQQVIGVVFTVEIVVEFYNNYFDGMAVHQTDPNIFALNRTLDIANALGKVSPLELRKLARSANTLDTDQLLPDSAVTVQIDADRDCTTLLPRVLRAAMLLYARDQVKAPSVALETTRYVGLCVSELMSATIQRSKTYQPASSFTKLFGYANCAMFGYYVLRLFIQAFIKGRIASPERPERAADLISQFEKFLSNIQGARSV